MGWPAPGSNIDIVVFPTERIFSEVRESLIREFALLLAVHQLRDLFKKKRKSRSSGNTSQIPCIFMGHSFLGNSWSGEEEGCELAPTERRGGSRGSSWFLFHMVEMHRRVAAILLWYLWDRKSIIRR